jgi:hypothetical protein
MPPASGLRRRRIPRLECCPFQPTAANSGPVDHHDPSDPWGLRRSPRRDDCHLHRTAAQCWIGRPARRSAPGLRRGLMDEYSLQRRNDVHRSVFGLSRGTARRTARAFGLCLCLHGDQPAPPSCSQPPRAADAIGSCRTHRWDVLSSDAFLCSAQSSHALCVAGDRDVRHGHRLHHQCRHLA